MKAAENPGVTFRNVAGEFLAGIVETSRAAFYAMLVGALSMIAFLFWFFSYSTIGGPYGKYLPAYTNDFYGYATYRAIQLGQVEDDRPLLLVLGSSITSSAFASEDRIRDALDDLTGQEWRVALLTNALQSPLEQIAYIETALGQRTDRQVVIVLGVDVTVNAWTVEELMEFEDHPRIGVRSNWADAEIERLGETPRRRMPSHLLENWQFSLVHAQKLLRRITRNIHYDPDFEFYTPDAPLPEAERQGDLIERQTREGFDTGSDRMLETLRHLADRLRSYPSVQLVLLHELPSEDLVARYDLEEIVATEDARYKALADDIGAHFWSPIAALPVPGEAFFDYFHIGREYEQQKLQNAQATLVASLARGRGQ